MNFNKNSCCHVLLELDQFFNGKTKWNIKDVWVKKKKKIVHCYTGVVRLLYIILANIFNRRI